MADATKEQKGTKFTDRQGREWIVEINYASLSAAERQGIDPILVITEEFKQSIAYKLRSPLWLANTLYVLCHEQIEERKSLNKERFCDAVIGARSDARNALIEAIFDFFQRAEMEAEATALRNALDGMEKAEKLAAKQADTGSE